MVRNRARIAIVSNCLKTLAGVAEWQTRSTQNALSERACGFESHHRHKMMKDVPQGASFIIFRVRGRGLNEGLGPQRRGSARRVRRVEGAGGAHGEEAPRAALRRVEGAVVSPTTGTK